MLYDKTFPPRPATASANTIGINKSMGRLMSGAAGGGTGSAEFDDMRQFNYYGQLGCAGGAGAPNIEDFTEADTIKLEQEVEELLRNRVTSFADNGGPGIVNITKNNNAIRVTKSAHVGKRQNFMMMNAAYSNGKKDQ